MSSSPLLAGVLQREYDRANTATTTSAPRRIPRKAPQERPKSTPAYPSCTGHFRPRLRHTHIYPANHLISARCSLLENDHPGYYALSESKQHRYALKMVLLEEQVDQHYHLHAHLSIRVTSRRALMAPRDVTRIRKMRKGLGVCGRKKVAKKLRRVLARKMWEKDPIVGGDGGTMWMSKGRTKRSSKLGCVERVDGAVEMMNNRREAQKRGAEMQRLEARFWGGYVRVDEAVLEPEPEWEKELRGDLSREGFEAFLESEGQELVEEPKVEYSGEDFAAFLES